MSTRDIYWNPRPGEKALGTAKNHEVRAIESLIQAPCDHFPLAVMAHRHEASSNRGFKPYHEATVVREAQPEIVVGKEDHRPIYKGRKIIYASGEISSVIKVEVGQTKKDVTGPGRCADK
jgi:hypothetical protein